MDVIRDLIVRPIAVSITATGDAIGIIFAAGLLSVEMAMTVRAAARAAVMLVAMLGAVVAGPLEDANEALKRKDYANAVRLYRPLAAKGDPSIEKTPELMMPEALVTLIEAENLLRFALPTFLTGTLL